MKNIRKIFGFLLFFVLVVGQMLNAFAGGNCTLYGMANYARDNVTEPLGCYNCEENGDTFSKNYGTCAGVYYNNQVISPDGTTTSVEEFCGEGKYFDYMMGACVDDCHKLFAEPDDENHVCDRTIFSDNYFCQNTDGFSWVIQPENSYTTYATPEDTECLWEDITRCVCMDKYDDGMFSSCESTNGDFVLPSGDTVKELDCINMGNYPDGRLCTCYPPFDARDLCKTSYYYDGSTCVSATACASAGKIANNDNHWCLTPGQVTITLNQNGGSGGLSSIDATSGSAMLPISSSNLPTKTGYNFMGYYTDVNGGSKYYNSNGTSANNCDLTTGTTLYAHWEAKEYTITFDANGGAGGPNPITQKYDSAMRTISVFPTKTGYTFSGYYDTSATSGGNKYYNANGTSAQNWNKVSNTTLYARWKANTYTVTLDANGGTGGTASVTATYDSVMPSATMPTKTGYVFIGFYDTQNATGGTQYYAAAGTSANIWKKTANTTLYARWTPNCNKITLNANGGNVGSTSVLYKKTDETTTFYTNSSCTTVYSATPSIVPSRTGYTFRGFYTSAISDVSSTGASGTRYIMHTGGISTAGQNWTISAPATLYAGWAKNCSTVANGTCSLSISENSVTYTTTCDTGYTISGNGTASPTCTANTNSITFNKNANDAVNANQVSGYTLVDYVQSSGTGDNTTTGQYIDSGYKPGPNTKVLVDYQLTNASNTGALFGNYSDTGGGASFAFYVTDNYAYAGSTTKITSGVSRDTARHTVTLDAKNKQFKYGNTVKTISTVSQCSHNMPIFARYYDGEIKYRVSAKIYNFKIYEGEVLVRNFMPAKENSTDTYGLYDMVSDSFFPPTGGNLTGGNESDFVQSVIYGTALPSVTPPTRTGYTFSGYYDAQTGGNQYYNSNGISTQTWTNTSDVTLYAHWTPNTITLLWDNGGHGTAPTSPASCVYGSTFTMPSALTATGYTFQNWSVNGETFSAGQPSVACDSATLGVTSGTATITANWGGGCFEITLNKNGGDSLGDIQSLYKKPGEKNNFYTDANCSEVYTTVEKIIPTRFGYTFRGFYAGANSFDKQYISNSGEITSDGAQWSTTSATILYAGWAQNCSTVTNGTCSLSINGNTVTYTTTCDTGYTISGNGTASPTCTANTYTVTLDKNDGTGTTTTVQAIYGSEMPSVTPPARTGYTFKGYYNATSGGTQYYTSAGASAITWNVPNNTTLYAQWTAKTYTVTLNANGGTGGTASVTATYGSAMPTATMPTKTGYVFIGYYDTANTTGGIQYYKSAGTSAQTWNKTSNTTLTARWTPKTYTLTFDANSEYANLAALPSGYTQYDYVASSGGQYIDTGVTASGTTDVKAKMSFTTIPSDAGVLAAKSSSNVRYYPLWYYAAWTYGYNSYYRDTTKKATAGTTYLVNSHIGPESQYININNAGAIAGAVAGPYTLTQNLYLFANNNNGSAGTKTSVKLYSMKLYQDGSLVRNFIPAKRNSDSVYGFYDLKGNTFYPSNATAFSSVGSTSNVVSTIVSRDVLDDAVVPIPSRSGWTFTGYYDTATGGTKYYDATGANIKAWDKDSDATLYAQWTQSCNAITLDPNGGTSGSVSVLYKKTDEAGVWYSNNTCTQQYTASSIIPTRTGYTFRGFFPSQISDISTTNTSSVARYFTNNGGQTTSGQNLTTSTSATLYAAWAKNCATVSNGTCSLAISGNSATYTTSCNTGYSISSGSGSATPVCSGNTYTVTLDANGGTGGTTSVTATYGSPMPTSSVTMPTKTGYTFTGYYDATSGGTQYYTSTGTSARTWNKANNTTTLTAQWRPIDYSVLINKNDTDAVFGDVMSGYTLLEYLESNGTAYIDTGIKGNLNTDIIIKAQKSATPDCMIFGYLDSSSGKGINAYFRTSANGNQRFGNKSQGVILNSSINTNTPFILRENKTGLYINGDKQATFDTTTSFETTGNLYLFRANKYTSSVCQNKIYYARIYENGDLKHNFVPVKNNDGTIGMLHIDYTNSTSTFISAPTGITAGGEVTNNIEITALYGVGLPTLPTVTLANNSFVGYFDATTGGNQYSTGTSWNKTNGATLYARWSQNAYTITLDKNGGTGSCGGATGTTSGTVTCSAGESCALPQYSNCSISQTKKVFVGWSTSSSATTGSFSITPTGNATVYAVWVTPTCTKGTGVASTSLSSVSSNKPVCNVTCNTGYYHAATQTGSAGATTLTTSCSACSNKPTNSSYSGPATTNACPWICNSGYFGKSESGATSCTICPNGSYCASGVQNSCPTPETNWTYASGTGWSSYSSCKEEKTGESISSYCSAGVLQKTASSATAWGTTATITTALSAKAGSYVNDQTCTQCTGATYSAGGTATSCTSCPTATSGWTRGTGTGWTNYSSCYQTRNATSVSTYCSAGKLKKVATSANAWGTTTIQTQLQAVEGAVVNGQNCIACPIGSTSSGGTATQCSACSAGYTTTAIGATQCTTCPDYDRVSSWENTTIDSTNVVSGLCKATSCKATFAFAETNSHEILNVATVNKGTQNAYINSNTNKVTSYSKNSIITIQTEIGKRYFIKKTVGSPYSGNSVIIGFSSSIPTTSTIFSNRSFGQSTSNNELTFVANDVYSTFLIRGDVDGANTSLTITSIVNGLQISVDNLTTNTCSMCDSGYYCSGGTSAAIICPNGSYCSGGIKNNCSSLSGVSVTGGTYTTSPTSGATANTACRYTAPTKTSTGCKTVTTNTVSYSGSSWPATTYSVTANAGYFIANNNTATAKCTQCPGGTYMETSGNTATNCTSCPAVTTGWTLNTTNTAQTSYTSCIETISASDISSYCESGSLKKTATSATAWGTATSVDLKAKAGSSLSGTGNNLTCTQCTGATYSAGGTATSCTACPTSYTADTTAGKTSASACKISVSGGNYIKTANDTTVTQCSAGTYKGTHTVAYGSTSSCSTCSGRTKYSAAGATSCSTVTSGYYTTGCNTSGNKCTGQSQCSNGTYCASGVQNNCPTGYGNSGNGTTSINDCYLTLTKGLYVASVGGGTSSCPANEYSDNTSKVYYGGTESSTHATTSTCSNCSSLGGGLYATSVAGSGSDGCYLTTTAGYYITSTDDTAQTVCPKSNYCPAATLYYPNIGNINRCPDATSYKRTTYPSDWYNVSSASVAMSTSTKRTALTSCSITYTVTNERGKFKISQTYNTTTNKYDTGGTKYYTVINPGYYGQTKYYADTTCNLNSSNTYKMYYKDVGICPAGYYCPGYTPIPNCNSGTYNTEMGKFACVNGSFSSENGGAFECTPCDPGYKNNGTGNTSCSDVCSIAHSNSWITPQWQTNNTMSPGICKLASCVPGYTVGSDNNGDICNPNIITINWDENGGSTSPSELVEIDDGSCEYGGSLLMPSVELYRTGYVFNGWSL